MRPRSIAGRKAVNGVVTLIAGSAAVFGLFMLLWILAVIFQKGAAAINWQFFTSLPSPPGETGGGLANAIVGTLMITAVATAMGVPVGMLAGTYLAEFGRDGRFARTVRLLAGILVGAPSIVIGVFVYTILVIPMRGFSGFAGSIALAIIMLPVVTRTTEDMLRLVPNSLRESALALGAPEHRMIFQVVFRAAKSGLLTGVMLAVARVSGETAPLLFTTLNSPYWNLSPAKPMGNLTVTIFSYAMSPYQDWQAKAWGASLLIAAGVLLLNLTARFLVREEEGRTVSEPVIDQPKVSVRHLDFHYGTNQALNDNNLDVAANAVTAIIGPSGCGKSTHIRCYNRIYEMYRGQVATGEILLDGKNVLDPSVDLIELRMRVGMIFQRPSPFPMSIFDNVAYGLRLQAKYSKTELKGRVEQALRDAALWDEVVDKLAEPGANLSGGQQQRMCIARAIAVEPDLLLMDEPASAIDPVGTAKIEELIDSLKRRYTIVIVTHNMQQAARVSDYTAFFYTGEVVEFGRTTDIFTRPKNKQTEDYITGRFG